MNTIKFYEDMNSKIKLTSLFLNENTFKLITSKKLDFIKRYQNILENLKFQSNNWSTIYFTQRLYLFQRHQMNHLLR